MRIFNREERLIVFSILFVIAFISFFNFRDALRRARDTQRKNDIGDIANALENYKNTVSYYPLSTTDGKIIGCADLETPVPCQWGKDNLSGFMNFIPEDPYTNQGVSYFYMSTGTHFQILAVLEGTDEDEYDEAIVARFIMCGSRICNFGRASPRTPLDKSLEEYENELVR